MHHLWTILTRRDSTAPFIALAIAAVSLVLFVGAALIGEHPTWALGWSCAMANAAVLLTIIAEWHYEWAESTWAKRQLVKRARYWATWYSTHRTLTKR